MEHYSAIKKNKMYCARKWIKLDPFEDPIWQGKPNSERQISVLSLYAESIPKK
jgi:hypothetical protein